MEEKLSYSELAERLRSQTESLVNRFSKRMNQLKEMGELLALIKNPKNGINLSFFGKDSISAVGIDGSMEYDERLEMLLFYVCATAFRGNFKLESGKIKFDKNSCYRDSRLSSSAAVPLWLEDMPNVSSDANKHEAEVMRELTLQKVPFSLMTMAELWTAIKALEKSETNVILLDRPISGTYDPAARDIRKILASGKSTLTKFKTEKGNMSMLDIRLAYSLGPKGLELPERSRFLVDRALKILIEGKEISKGELANKLGIDDETLGKLLKKLEEINNRYDNQLIEELGIESIKLKSGVDGYWERALSTAYTVCRRAFESKEHPLEIDDSWMNIQDINAVNLFLIYQLLNMSASGKILVIGISKDTTATDLSRSVIPYTLGKTSDKNGVSYLNLKDDRSLLTVLSAVQSDYLKTPWRTAGYDACFATLVSDENAGLRAARKVVSRERLFVRVYFQLRSFKTEPLARSPVFVYERFYMPEMDKDFVSEIKAIEREKEVKLNAYFEGKKQNEVDDLIISLLSQSDEPEVVEAFGHNILLYLADKAVKAEVKNLKGMLRIIADKELGYFARKEKIFTITRRFREMRTEAEQARSFTTRGSQT